MSGVRPETPMPSRPAGEADRALGRLAARERGEAAFDLVCDEEKPHIKSPPPTVTTWPLM